MCIPLIAAVPLIAAAVGAGTAVYSANQQRKGQRESIAAQQKMSDEQNAALANAPPPVQAAVAAPSEPKTQEAITADSSYRRRRASMNNVGSLLTRGTDQSMIGKTLLGS